jgi:hypothetical protein
MFLTDIKKKEDKHKYHHKISELHSKCTVSVQPPRIVTCHEFRAM